MFIGGLGAGAISQIADAFPASGQTRFPAPDTTTANTGAASSQSLTTPQPPTGETAIGKAAAKLVTDLKSLLLSVQAEQSLTSPGKPFGSTKPGAATPLAVTTA